MDCDGAWSLWILFPGFPSKSRVADLVTEGFSGPVTLGQRGRVAVWTGSQLLSQVGLQKTWSASQELRLTGSSVQEKSASAVDFPVRPPVVGTGDQVCHGCVRLEISIHVFIDTTIPPCSSLDSLYLQKVDRDIEG